jgi:hypothetical protein
MNVKGFAFNDEVLDALFAALSPERMATYILAAGGDREKALRLYTWNTAVSAAFYGPLQGLEVALRNALHRELTAAHGPAWYDDPACGLDAGALVRIAAAGDNLRRSGYVVDPPHIVAELPFGFWVSLLGRGGRAPTLGAPRRNYEMTLWRPCLHRAFRHARLRRTEAHRPLDYLRTFRNRIAHHEPIFTRHLEADYGSLLTVTGWICPRTREWIEHHSRVEALLGRPRDADDVLF